MQADLAIDGLLKKVLCFLVDVLILQFYERSISFGGVLPYLKKNMLKRLGIIDVDGPCLSGN